jgi:hypothetical protein
MSAEMTISFILHTVDVYVIAIARQHFRRRAKCSLDKQPALRTHFRAHVLWTYLSMSFSFVTSKLSSHPASMRILTPPSNSRSDCDAAEADCAPSKGVKLNMIDAFSGHDYCDLVLRMASRLRAVTKCVC